MNLPATQAYIPFQNHLSKLYLGALIIQILHIVVLVIARMQGLVPPTMMNHLVATAVFIVLIGFAYYFYKKSLASLSITLFLIGTLVATSSQIWHGNGLNDPATIALPGIVILAALLGNFRNFVTVLLVTLLVTSIIGVGTLQEWVPHNKNTGAMDVIGFISIVVISGLAIGWYAKDFNATVHGINEENKRFRESEEAIFHLAHHDVLTGLLNVRACQAHYSEYLRILNYEKYVLIVIFIDLDNFKTINDTYSHNAGDQLLIETAKRMQRFCHDDDLACRLGGDEFILVCKREKQYSVDRLADELLKDLTQDFKVKGVHLEISASVGIALAPQDGINFDEVRKKADFAMIKSKQKGKSTWSLYNADLHQDILRKSSIVSGLREALNTHSLELYFQPKVNLQTGKPIGAEALLRWSRNNPYNIRPDEFIPVIESSSLMIDIGSWVIEEACVACKRWHMAGFTDMRIAINVSVQQLSRNNLKPVLQHALAKAGLAPRFLEIELTEHLLLSNTKEVVKQLEQIKAIGVTLAIDDFGTGYSNLSYLSKFKVDILKLDQTFIHNLNQYKESLDIVTAVITMAKILGLKTIAEGIETEEQWHKLRHLGCDLGQGYLWEKPLPSANFEAYLQKSIDKEVILA